MTKQQKQQCQFINNIYFDSNDRVRELTTCTTRRFSLSSFNKSEAAVASALFDSLIIKCLDE
jgi:hypothetical protein